MAKVTVVIDVEMEEFYHPFVGVTARNVAFLNSIGAELRLGWRIREPEDPEEYTDPERVARDVRRRQELGDALWAWGRAVARAGLTCSDEYHRASLAAQGWA